MDFNKEIAEKLYQIMRDLRDTPNFLTPNKLMLEGYVAGFEHFCDMLGTEPLKGSFFQFRHGDQQSAEFFIYAFERRNNCKLGFIPCENRDVIEKSKELENKYEGDFMDQWQRYLESIHDIKSD